MAVGLLLLAGSAPANSARARSARADEPVDFDARVWPILAEHCLGCHGASQPESGLRLDRRETMLRGGDLGEPVIVPGSPETSPLWIYIRDADHDLAMPPAGDGRRRLQTDEVETLRKWIAEGAQWGSQATATQEASNHWSFQALPNEWSQHSIDGFIDQQLAQAGLQRTEDAPPHQLIRRLYWNLIGLPPTYTRVQQFVQSWERDPDLAVAQLVDELLASPQYGERWARHWLDVVRFAESDGFEMNHPRPTAWHFRDYCVEAFNSDLPYDTFIRQQLAGDRWGEDRATGFLVGGPWDRVKSPDPVLTANQRADELHDMVSVTGTAFLGLTVGCARCHSHKFDPITQIDYYRIKACLSGVQHGERPLQTTPSPQREAAIQKLQAELAGVTKTLRALEPLASLTPYGQASVTEVGEATRSFAVRAPVSHRENVDRFAPMGARYLRFEILATNSGEPCIDELEILATDGTNVARTASVTSSGDFANNAFHRLEHVHDGQYGNERSWISSTSGRGRLEFDFGQTREIECVLWSRDRTLEPRYTDRVATRYTISVSTDGQQWTSVADDVDRMPIGTPASQLAERAGASAQDEIAKRSELEQTQRDLTRQLAAWTSAPKAYAGVLGAPEEVRRFQRGDPTQPREAIAPGSIEALVGFSLGFSLGADASDVERRVALADWIASPTHPLTARVMVNRLWHYHFGCGIVDTPSDFGAGGGRPSHPELLDFLARRLIDEGWSLKAIQRLICNSKTYRQASYARSPEAARSAMQSDASNRWLWHYPPRRLEAEPLRDAILAMSGSLDLKMGGPGFDLFVANDNYVRVFETKTQFTSADYRRMVYQTKPRVELDQLFGAFDCPDAGQIQPRRTVSTTPLQALNMLNSAFLIEQSERFAERLERETREGIGSDSKDGNDNKDSSEEAIGLAFRIAFSREPTEEEVRLSRGLIREHGLAALCRGILNAHEFIMIY